MFLLALKLKLITPKILLFADRYSVRLCAECLKRLKSFKTNSVSLTGSCFMLLLIDCTFPNLLLFGLLIITIPL